MNLSRCQDVVEVATEHLEGGLSPADEQAFAAHLAECEGCSTYLAQMRTTVDALRGLGTDSR